VGNTGVAVNGTAGTNSAVGIKVVADLLAAIQDGRTDDMLALVDPQVIWKSSVRPGLSLYTGHAGLIEYCNDLRAALGSFRFEIQEITVVDQLVTVRIHMIRRTEQGEQPPDPADGIFTVINGLVVTMDSQP
jgi:hypothetical protein